MYPLLWLCFHYIPCVLDENYLCFSPQRGDSLDTIFASSPPSDQIDRRSKLRTRKKNSPKHRSDHSANRSWEESSDQESMEMQDLPRSLSPFRQSGLVADVTGNLHQVGDSVILQIDDSSSAAYSSSSDCERQRRRRGVDRMDSQDIDNEYEDDDEEEEEEQSIEGSDDEEELHCDDWEIRMLAAEMERRENSLAEESSGQHHHHHYQAGNSSVGVRRRRKRSETDEATEQSEHEVEQQGQRPRASSLDQNKTTRRGRGFFKALSFDRDKDRL